MARKREGEREGEGEGGRRGAMRDGASSCEATSQVHNFEMNMATKEF